MNDPVAAWLESLGLDRYRELFEQNAITWDVLPELNDGDLVSMGIVLGHRKQLLRAIAQLSHRGEDETATTLAILHRERHTCRPLPVEIKQNVGN